MQNNATKIQQNRIHEIERQAWFARLALGQTETYPSGRSQQKSLGQGFVVLP